MRHIATITDVAERQLCTGCGVCAHVQPDEIRMVDDVDHGRRPLVDPGASTDEALQCCPGIGLTHGDLPTDSIASLRDTWGPVLEVWEGHAGDDHLRFTASSGGVSSALALHAIEEYGMGGLLHIRSRPDRPYLNETTYSTDRDAILAAVGSRYAPASPCDGLDLLDGDAPSVFIGKPCDVAAARKAARLRPGLDRQLGLTIAMFCAGTPTLRGTFEMLAAMGIDDPDTLEALRYRGHGWPGGAVATVRGPDGQRTDVSLTYDESWGSILQRHRQWRCYVCADHTGEFADVSVGDPWYRPPDGDEPGRSLVLIRTERGRELFASAVRAGAIVATRTGPSRLPESQPWLERIRGEAGARAATLRAVGIPAPVYRNMPHWPVWFASLSTRDKIRSTAGTIRRIRRKGLHRRHPVRPISPAGGDT